MTEQERVESIRRNGGRHLQNFKKENITYEMCVIAVSDDGTAIHMVPDDYKTEELYRIACKTYGGALVSVPEQWKSQTLCELAVSSDGTVIDYVPKHLLSQEMFFKAVCSAPAVMSKMPDEMLTPAFCLKIIENSGAKALSSLPKTHRTEDFYLSLIHKQPDIIWNIPKAFHTKKVSKATITSMGYKSTEEAVRDNPKLLSQLHTSLYDHETCLAFVQSPLFHTASDYRCSGFNTESDEKNGMLYLDQQFDYKYSLKHLLQWLDVCEAALKIRPILLTYIKQDLISLNLCKIALENDEQGFVFSVIPKEYRTKELSQIAFEKDAHCIEDIPEEYLTPELCLDAVKRSGYVLKILPERFKTKAVCLAAVKNMGSELESVPVEVLDEEICLEAFINIKGFSYCLLGKVPEPLRTYDVCHAAVKADGNNIQYVPESKKTYELCLDAVKRTSHILEYIPKNYFTEELCLSSISQRTIDFDIIPKECLNEKICLEALKHESTYGTVLGKIPSKLITQEMCDRAIKNSVWSLQDIPYEFITENILMHVAEIAPGRLADNFPEHFRTQEFAEKVVSHSPSAKPYLEHIIGFAISEIKQVSDFQETINYVSCPSLNRVDGVIIHFIQQSLFEGKQPNKDGVYIFSRKELISGSGVSASTMSKHITTVAQYLQLGHDLKKWARYDDYAGEQLFINVAYENGKLSFQQNPLTNTPELSYLWALPPLDSYFAYDCFDEKHRRRTNGPAKYDAIPWTQKD